MNRRLHLLENELGLSSNHKVADIKIVINKVNTSLNADPEERKIYMKQKFLSSALVAAIVLTISSLTVFAAVQFGWNEKLIEYFNPTEQQMEQLESSVNTPLISAESNGYTVNVLQTITDNHAIYILYELIAPKDVILTDDLQWKNDFLEYASEAEDERGAYGGISSKMLEVNGNKATILRCEEQNGKFINNQDITLQLEDLAKYTTTDNEIKESIVGKCSFNLSWKLVYSDTTKVFEINKKVRITDGLNNTLEKIEVSPMSVWVFVKGDNGTMAAKPVINFKNGAKTELVSQNDFNHSYSFNKFWGKDGGIISLSYKFNKITDISEIESVTVGDLTVPIK